MDFLIDNSVHIASLLVAICALLITYIAISAQHKPHILIYYRANPNIQTIVDLVIENVGKGVAFDVKFSKPLPVRLYGVEKLTSKKISTMFEGGIPYLGAAQKLVTDGGQFGGINQYLEEGFDFNIKYKYKNPFSITRTMKQKIKLSISHLNKIPTRCSGDQAIVDALKGKTGTTLHRIETSLRSIKDSLKHNKIDAD